MSEQFNDGEILAANKVLTPEPHVGEKLRRAREALGISEHDIAHALKLGPRQVEALEAGNWLGLPGNTFVRGFVRNYARIVQIDAAPLMIQLDGSLEKQATNLTVSESPPATMPHAGGATRRDRAVVMTGVGLVVVASLAYFLMPNDLTALRESTQGLLNSLARTDEPAPVVAAPTLPAPAEPIFPPGTTPQQIMNPQAQTVADVAPSAALPVPAVSSSLPPAAEKPAAIANAPQLRFVFDKESWLEVRDRDNKQIFSQRVPAGTEQTLSGAGPLSLVVGYAPGVRVFSHGQAVDLAPHTRGEVARLVLE
ncbi:MAG TPA: RodZ domain-containing protein [Azonexus sp.]|nr:RodZ domain-containing protein [Azonexus sp.]